jgi:hypothetical protein
VRIAAIHEDSPGRPKSPKPFSLLQVRRKELIEEGKVRLDLLAPLDLSQVGLADFFQAQVEDLPDDVLGDRLGLREPDRRDPTPQAAAGCQANRPFRLSTTLPWRIVLHDPHGRDAWT